MKDTGALTAAGGGLDPALFAAGAGGHPWIKRLASGAERPAGGDLADAVHWLSLLHGGAAGLVDRAALSARSPDERAVLTRAHVAWLYERRALSGLAVAVGPMPVVAGQATDEATVDDLVRAVSTLATSERAGVTLGAAAALLVDWCATRALLDRAAERFGATVPRCDLPDPIGLCAAVAGLCGDRAVERAVLFGAGQLLERHRALADLLQRRAAGRAH